MTAPTRRAAWHDAFDAQMALWRWYRTPHGMRWAANCARVAGQVHGAPTRELILRLWDGETGRLLDCDPIYVSEGMCDVVEAARESFAPEPLLETDVLTPRAFLWFARPISMPDRFGNEIQVHAVSWAREYASETPEQGAEAQRRLHDDAAWAKGDRIRPPEMDELIAEGLIFPYGLNVTLYAGRDHYLDVVHQDDHYVPDWVAEATKGLAVLPFHASPWHFNETFYGNEADATGVPSGMDEWWKLLQTTFRLMQQRLASKRLHLPHRTMRHEAKRLGVRPDTEIVVVRLRRERDEDEWLDDSGAPGEANYSHRFIVSGHWRNQPYPSENITRQIWISPYVKGPEDKPLIVRPRRVFTWTR